MTAQATAVGVTGTGAVLGNPCTYRGLSIRDTSGVTNIVRVYDNAAAASGKILAAFQLAGNASALDTVPDGVRAENGLFLETTGAVEGSVRHG